MLASSPTIEILPAGPLRRIKVSGLWVNRKSGAPFYVQTGDGPWEPVRSVEIRGPSWMRFSDGVVRRAWLETESEVQIER